MVSTDLLAKYILQYRIFELSLKKLCFIKTKISEARDIDENN